MSLSDRKSAEDRYREAFARLRSGNPLNMPSGTSVSQNNIAKEAGTDPTALKKSRYPALIREIQAYVDIDGHQKDAKKKLQANRIQRKRDLEQRVVALETQRDQAQAKFLSAQRLLRDLMQENASLRARLDDLSA